MSPKPQRKYMKKTSAWKNIWKKKKGLKIYDFKKNIGDFTNCVFNYGDPDDWDCFLFVQYRAI